MFADNERIYNIANGLVWSENYITLPKVTIA